MKCIIFTSFLQCKQTIKILNKYKLADAASDLIDQQYSYICAGKYDDFWPLSVQCEIDEKLKNWLILSGVDIHEYKN